MPFYRHRAAREQYLFHFIVAVRRGNNIFAVLSSPCSAETIFSRFIVTAQRGNNIFAILSSPRGAETIFLPFYRHRAAREQYFCISSFAALLRALKFLFSSLQNGGTCWNGRGGACVPARTSAQRRFHTKTHALCVGIERWMRPCKATRAGIQAPPLPISIIFFHAIPHKQNNHLCVIHPNEINRPTRNPPNESNRSHAQSPKRNRRGGAYVPARTSAQRRFHPKMRCCHPQMLRFHLRKACFHVQTTCFYPRKAPPNDGCALAGRHGRAHRHRPYHAYRTASKRRNYFSNKTNGRTCADAIRADVNTLAEGF